MAWVVFTHRKLYSSEAVLSDSKSREIAQGCGMFPGIGSSSRLQSFKGRRATLVQSCNAMDACLLFGTNRAVCSKEMMNPLNFRNREKDMES